jgi:hypothetical protein
VRDLPPEVMERAFYGHLEHGSALESGAEFSAFVNRAELAANENQLPEHLLPDFATGRSTSGGWTRMSTASCAARPIAPTDRAVRCHSTQLWGGQL